jgi:hypothetical protein
MVSHGPIDDIITRRGHSTHTYGQCGSTCLFADIGNAQCQENVRGQSSSCLHHTDHTVPEHVHHYGGWIQQEHTQQPGMLSFILLGQMQDHRTGPQSPPPCPSPPTFPKSSAVSRYLPEGDRSHELTSVPSDSGGQMPMTGNPRTQVQLAHLTHGEE